MRSASSAPSPENQCEVAGARQGAAASPASSPAGAVLRTLPDVVEAIVPSADSTTEERTPSAWAPFPVGDRQLLLVGVQRDAGQRTSTVGLLANADAGDDRVRDLTGLLAAFRLGDVQIEVVRPTWATLGGSTVAFWGCSLRRHRRVSRIAATAEDTTTMRRVRNG